MLPSIEGVQDTQGLPPIEGAAQSGLPPIEGASDSGLPSIEGVDTGKDTSLGQAFEGGVPESIVGAGAGVLGYKPFKEEQNMPIRPWSTIQGAAQHVARMGGQILPDAAALAMANLIPGVGEVTDAMGPSALLARLSGESAASVAERFAAKEGISGVLQRLGLNAAKGAVGVGGYEAIRSPLSQLSDTGQINPSKWGSDIMSGAGTGAILSPLLHLPGEALRGLQKQTGIGDEAAGKVRGIMGDVAKEAAEAPTTDMPNLEGEEGISTDTPDVDTYMRGRIAERFQDEGLGELLIPKSMSSFSSLKNAKTVMNEIENQTGIPAGSIIDHIYGVEQSLTHDILDYTKGRNLLEAQGNALGVAPERLAQLLDAQAKGIDVGPITPQEQTLLDAHKTLTDSMYNVGTKKWGMDIKYSPDQYYSMQSYRSSLGFSGDTPEIDPKTPGDYLASIQQEKLHKVEPELMETDPYKRLDNYMSTLKNKVLREQIAPQFRDVYKQLQLMGQNEYAGKIKKLFSAYFPDGQTNKVYMDQAPYTTDGVKDIGSILAAEKTMLKKPLFDMIMHNLNDTFYTGAITANPRIWIAHALQPLTMGMGDGLAPWLPRAYARMAMKGGEYAEALDKNVDEITSGHIPWDERTMFNSATQEKDPLFFRALKAVGAPLDKGFTGLMNFNRKVLFLAGKDRIMTQGVTEDLMKPLLAGERRMVQESMATGGIDAASDTYGKIMANRNMFIFSSADRPEVLQGAMGRYIPFTTWSRNTIMRAIEDVETGNMGNVAKRIAYAYALDKTFETLTGYHFRGLSPYNIQDKEALTRLPFIPVASGVIQPLVKGQFTPAAIAGIRTLGAPGSLGARGASIEHSPEPKKKALQTFGLTKVGQ